VLLFELLTGRLPFRGDAMHVLYHQHLTAPLPAVGRADLPAWVEQLVAKMLAKSPHERYQSAAEALDDLGHGRVLSAGLPTPRKRECVACGASTLAELVWCTSCGYALVERFGQGRFGVCVTEATDGAALAGYVRTVLGGRLRTVPARGGVLVKNLDHATAECLRQSARRHDVVLTIRRHPLTRRVKRIASLLGCFFCAVL